MGQIWRPGATVGGLGVLLVLAGCGGAAELSHDPCTLLSPADVEPFVGILATPPYRSSDGAPDRQGDECLYVGRDGREVALRPDWSGGGATAGDAVLRVSRGLGQAMTKGGASGADSLAGRVVQGDIAGPWDRASWIPGGSLFASKGALSLQVDVSGASGQRRDAIALATAAMPRFDQPLKYDGAKAVALAPRPFPRPASACGFTPSSEVEAAIGPLAQAPASDAPESSCTYRVTTAAGQQSYPIEFTWEGGRKNYQVVVHQMATVAGVMGLPATSPLDTMTPPPQMKAAIGGLMKMLANGGAGGSAPGAAATIGFKTDTTLQGPWDHAAVLHGTQLIAVRHDVMVGINLASADYDRARRLLAAICTHL